MALVGLFAKGIIRSAVRSTVRRTIRRPLRRALRPNFDGGGWRRGGASRSTSPGPVKAGVQVHGLKELRRDMRAMGPAFSRDLSRTLRQSAESTAAEARALAPVRSGRLAGSIRAGSRGNSAVVRSPLPYAGVQHWGGTIAPRGTPIRIEGSHFITRAMDDEQIMNAVEEAFDDMARRHGWH